MTPRKERALQALLVCRTRAEAARSANIGESTLREYMKDPEFLARYRAAFAEIVELATRQAQWAMMPAVAALKEIVENEGEPATARIQAARSLLEYSLKMGEQIDITARMVELERAIAEMEEGGVRT